MTFKEAVEMAPPPVNRAYRAGKKALANQYRSRVTCPDSRRLTGSIDLDSVLQKTPGHADKPRWDYGLGYRPANGKEQAIWVEVHSATTKEVSAVLKKLQWLRDWLNSGAQELRQLTDFASDNCRFVWIASSSVKISRNSPQARRLSQSGLPNVQRHLRLP
jgi:hypothetical protein